MSTVYVKQQMVELHNPKCYICIDIYISISLRLEQITSRGQRLSLVVAWLYTLREKLNTFLGAMSQEQKTQVQISISNLIPAETKRK